MRTAGHSSSIILHGWTERVSPMGSGGASGRLPAVWIERQKGGEAEPAHHTVWLRKGGEADVSGGHLCG